MRGVSELPQIFHRILPGLLSRPGSGRLESQHLHHVVGGEVTLNAFVKDSQSLVSHLDVRYSKNAKLPSGSIGDVKMLSRNKHIYVYVYASTEPDNTQAIHSPSTDMSVAFKIVQGGGGKVPLDCRTEEVM